MVTIELPNSNRTPLDAEMNQMWLDLLRWMSERVGQPSGLTAKLGAAEAVPKVN